MDLFDGMMVLVWLWLAGCIALWAWIMSGWICDSIQDYRDRRDRELMATHVIRMKLVLPGLDTQLREHRGVRDCRNYRALQDLIVTETKNSS